jgi:hypothetical protein
MNIFVLELDGLALRVIAVVVLPLWTAIIDSGYGKKACTHPIVAIDARNLSTSAG